MRNIHKLTALTTALLATTALAAPAQAASLQVTSTQTDFVEEADFNYQVSGLADEQHDLLQVYAQSKTDSGCIKNPENSSFSRQLESTFVSWDTGANFDFTYATHFDEPGNYLICAYIFDFYNPEEKVTSALTLNVHDNNASISASTDRIIKRNRKIDVQITGSTEVPRHFFVALIRKNKRGCGSHFNSQFPYNSFDSWGEWLGFEENSLDGELTQDITLSGVSRPGKYSICSWVQEDQSDAKAEATGQTTFTVKRRKRH